MWDCYIGPSKRIQDYIQGLQICGLEGNGYLFTLFTYSPYHLMTWGKKKLLGGWHKQACSKKGATEVIGEGNPRDQFSKVENKWNLGHLSLSIAVSSPKLKCKQTPGHTSPCLGGSSSEERVWLFCLVILIDFTSILFSGKAECGFQWLLIMPSEGRF